MRTLAINNIRDIEQWFENEPAPIVGQLRVRGVDSPDDEHTFSQRKKYELEKCMNNGEPMPIHEILSNVDQDDMEIGFSIMDEGDDYGQSLSSIIENLL